jgi:hypothetical protein
VKTKVFAHTVYNEGVVPFLMILEKTCAESAALREALRIRGVAGQSLQKELKQLAGNSSVKRRGRASYVSTKKLILRLFRDLVEKEFLERSFVSGKPQ